MSPAPGPEHEPSYVGLSDDLSIDEAGRSITSRAQSRLNVARRWLVAVVGVGLLVAAVVTIARNQDAALQAWSAAKNSPAWMVALALLLPLANIASVSAAFWIMTQRYGRVRLAEMLSLICAGWMLNNLPLRPGLIGRVSYHAVVNKIPVRASLLVLAQMLVCAGAALAIMLATLYFANAANASTIVVVTVACATTFTLAALAWALKKSSSTHAWRWAACVACRYVDIAVWALRYWLIFRALGEPISMLRSGIVAAISEAAMLSPVQIGLREWVVGMTSTWLSEYGTPARDQLTIGLLADLTNRGIEVALGVPLGLIAAAWLFKRLKAARRSESAAPRPGTSV